MVCELILSEEVGLDADVLLINSFLNSGSLQT